MHYSTTFVNNAADGNIEEAGRKALARTIEAFSFWMENGISLDRYEFENHTRRELLEHFDGGREQVREVEDIIEEYKNGCGDFHEYGLSFDFVEATEDHNGYYCYQMSWGGPSDELRIYQAGLVEYVYLDWFCGVGFECTACDSCQWLKQEFEEMGLIDFESKSYEELEQSAHTSDECEED